MANRRVVWEDRSCKACTVYFRDGSKSEFCNQCRKLSPKERKLVHERMLSVVWDCWP